MTTKIIHGNIFNTECECIVNTVNCVGFMGKGIALEMSIRYPEMEQIYKEKCAKNEIQIGKLWFYEPTNGLKKVLNFPTKYSYKYPSKIEYIEQGLQYFVNHYKEYSISSIAFSMLGATNGKIPPEKSLEIMKKYLDGINDLRIEIYINDREKLVRDTQFNGFLSYLSTHQNDKNSKLLDYIIQNPKVINFADVVEAKYSEEQQDGTYKTTSVATKKYLQSLVLDISNQKPSNTQMSLFA